MALEVWEVSLVPAAVVLRELLQMRSMTPILMTRLFDAQSAGIPGLRGLLAPGAAVVMLVGDTKFTEGPGWSSKTRLSWS